MQNGFWGGAGDVFIRGQGDSGAYESTFHHLRGQHQDVVGVSYKAPEVRVCF